MNARKIAYWVTTGLTVLPVCLVGGVANLAHGQPQVEGIVSLGYPVYLLTILGAWKVLAGITLLAPRFPRLKEWAYAGIAFDLTGAAFSHASVGDPAWKQVVPLVLLGIAMTSWALRPSNRTVARAPAAAGAPVAAPEPA